MKNQVSDTADVSQAYSEALLPLKEYRFASILIFAFLILNLAGQLFFKVNGAGLVQNIMILPTLAFSLWAFFRKPPMLQIRYYGAFCAGLFACFYYSASDNFSAAAVFLYWMVLSVFTLRMKRGIGAAFFIFSIVLLIKLI